MKTVLRNLLAVLIGLIAGGLVNLGLIKLGGVLIPAPAGVDPNDMDSLMAGMHLFQPQHFLFPFLAHALGTLVGAILATWSAVSHRLMLAMAVGILFLAGGVAAAWMLPAPAWFIIADLMLAYLPMAWLGAWLVCRAK